MEIFIGLVIASVVIVFASPLIVIALIEYFKKRELKSLKKVRDKVSRSEVSPRDIHAMYRNSKPKKKESGENLFKKENKENFDVEGLKIDWKGVVTGAGSYGGVFKVTFHTPYFLNKDNPKVGIKEDIEDVNNITYRSVIVSLELPKANNEDVKKLKKYQISRFSGTIKSVEYARGKDYYQMFKIKAYNGRVKKIYDDVMENGPYPESVFEKLLGN
jgi:hypothetical protein